MKEMPSYKSAKNVWLWYHVKLGELDAVLDTRFRVNIAGEEPTGDGVLQQEGPTIKDLITESEVSYTNVIGRSLH
jgi:hypothetical protein